MEHTTNSANKPLSSNAMQLTNSEKPSKKYLAMMQIIVNDSYLASARTGTMAEKTECAEIWSRLLFPVIPEDRLQECFDIAFRNHTSPFPVNAIDLKRAWESLPKPLTQAEIDKSAALEAVRASMEMNGR